MTNKLKPAIIARIFIATAGIFWPAALPAYEVELSRLDGKVEIRRFGASWHHARVGDRLNPGDRVRTSELGRTLVSTPGGWMLELGDSTSLELNETLPDEYNQSVVLFEGAIRAVLLRPEAERATALEISTASGTVKLLGGDADIEIGPGGSAIASPVDGRLSTHTGQGALEATAGQVLVMSPDGKVSLTPSSPDYRDAWKKAGFTAIRTGLKPAVGVLSETIKKAAYALGKGLDDFSAAEAEIKRLLKRLGRTKKNRAGEKEELKGEIAKKFEDLWMTARTVQEARNFITTGAAAVRTACSASAGSIYSDAGREGTACPGFYGDSDPEAATLKVLRTGFRTIFHDRIAGLLTAYEEFNAL